MRALPGDGGGRRKRRKVLTILIEGDSGAQTLKHKISRRREKEERLLPCGPNLDPPISRVQRLIVVFVCCNVMNAVIKQKKKKKSDQTPPSFTTGYHFHCIFIFFKYGMQ